jgi:hypothetical protein
MLRSDESENQDIYSNLRNCPFVYAMFYQFISGGSQLKYENGFVTHKQKTRESLFNDILAFSWSRRKDQDGN